ncbi:MAG: NAD(+)/NADH kinase [Blautia sp.]|nr:NAD(+)/NADH kinase [Blautia sp.]
MRRFYIIANETKERGLANAGVIERYLKDRGCSCRIAEVGERPAPPYRYTDPEKIPQDMECIIVLGGDGTLLQAARDVVETQIPLIGINFGDLGFLAEVDRSSMYTALDKLICDEATIEERMMLEGEIIRDGKIIGNDIALNDIVICRDGNLRVVKFINYVNGEYLNAYPADGIIISTPTGSTGYSLSAGGPIVAPRAMMTIMTPIAPHTMNTRSIVFPGDDVLTIEIGQRRQEDTEKCIAAFDGGTLVEMKTGDRIRITKADVKARIFKLNHLSFVEVLRRKMR